MYFSRSCISREALAPGTLMALEGGGSGTFCRNSTTGLRPVLRMWEGGGQPEEKDVSGKASGMALQGVVGLGPWSPEAIQWSSLCSCVGKLAWPCVPALRRLLWPAGSCSQSRSGLPPLVQGGGRQRWQERPHLVGESPLLARPCPPPSSRWKQREARGPRSSTADPRPPSTAQQSQQTVGRHQKPGA